jgi:hypothetical protein
MANFFDRINPFKFVSQFQIGAYGFDEEEEISVVSDFDDKPQPVVPTPEARTMALTPLDKTLPQTSHTERLAQKQGLTVDQFLALKEQPKAPQNTDNVVTLFPSWLDDQRCAPNEILRSSLFAVVKKGERTAIQSQLMAAWDDDEIYFTGVQLDQYDLDVWLHCLHLYRKCPVGNKVHFTFREFLKALGKSPSGQNLRTLKQSLDRLQAGGIKLRTRSAKKSYTGSLIEKYYEDEEMGMWCLVINPDFLPFFTDETTWLNWEIRKSLSGSLSKWLMGWICTHKAQADAPQKIKLENIQKLSGCNYSTLHHLKSDVKKSLKELQEKAIIQSWEFDRKNVLSVARPPKALQP